MTDDQACATCVVGVGGAWSRGCEPSTGCVRSDVGVQVVEPDVEYVVTLTVSGNGHNGTGPMGFRLASDFVADVKIS